jgi:phosphinothricin acetyltransferase
MQVLFFSGETNMSYSFTPMRTSDGKAVIDIFNFFIENSFAAYPEEKVDISFYDRLMEMAEEYPSAVVRDESQKIVGFALLHAHHRAHCFRRCAEITYFLLPQHTRRGIGSRVLAAFAKEAKAMGIDTILASISSLNLNSIRFHQKQGFVECGRFRRIGKKFDKDFDVIWMQKCL